MVDRIHCDYCDKYIRSGEEVIIIHIESEGDEPCLYLHLELCSTECLENTLDLGSKVVAEGCTPTLDECFKEQIAKKQKREISSD